VETIDSPNGCVCSSSLRGVTPCNITLLDHSGKSITNVDRAHQLMLSFIEANRKRGKEITGYEYAVLVTNTSYEILSLGQLYRDRADAENAFDELKNQWGWGGYTTHDLHRCQLAARAVALIYNWWSLFVRLAHPEARREAITSRPWLMTSVGRKTEHAGQTTVTLTGLHAHFAPARAALTRVSALLQGWVAETAEQLPTHLFGIVSVITSSGFSLGRGATNASVAGKLCRMKSANCGF
jgi:hypothetical protein